jgi:erythrocyte band 7 integral membrane protein
MLKLPTNNNTVPPVSFADDDEEYLVSSNKKMVTPHQPEQESYARRIPKSDIDVIDPRLEEDYSKKEIYSEFGEANCMKSCYVCTGTCCRNMCVVCAACGCGPVKIINQGEIGLLIRFGRVLRKLPPGLHSINGCTDKVIVADMRLNTTKNTQTSTTKDNLTVQISIFGTWRITHPEVFFYKVSRPNYLM